MQWLTVLVSLQLYYTWFQSKIYNLHKVLVLTKMKNVSKIEVILDCLQIFNLFVRKFLITGIVEEEQKTPSNGLNLEELNFKINTIENENIGDVSSSAIKNTFKYLHLMLICLLVKIF